jgi:hypothetical protein
MHSLLFINIFHIHPYRLHLLHIHRHAHHAHRHHIFNLNQHTTNVYVRLRRKVGHQFGQREMPSFFLRTKRELYLPLPYFAEFAFSSKYNTKRSWDISMALWSNLCPKMVVHCRSTRTKIY